MKRWTQEEVEFLKEYYPTVNTELIGNILGRDAVAVRSKANQLRLKKLRIDSQDVVRTEARRSPHGMAFAYLLHIAHQNGATDQDTISKCMEIVRDGHMDEMIYKERILC